MDYSIKEVADISGVTVRTLHHYDKIGLLSPIKNESNNYRMYSDYDLEKLQQILLLKEMGFSLQKIKDFLSSKDYNRKSALEHQLTYLKNQVNRYNDLIGLVNSTLKDIGGSKVMSGKDLFKGFDYDAMKEDQKKYEDEVKERWGDTDAYKESDRRSKNYSKEDWEGIMSLQQNSLNDLASLYKDDVPVDDPRVQTVVNNNRFIIDKYFYSCSKEMFASLGEMYVADERFKAFYDGIVPGLAEYYREAIRVYCK